MTMDPNTSDNDHVSNPWTFSIRLDVSLNSVDDIPSSTSNTNDDCYCCLPEVPDSCRRLFQENGFIVFPKGVLSIEACNALNRQLEEILRGRYNTGHPPDKCPRKFKSEYVGSEYIKIRNKERKDGSERMKTTTTTVSKNNEQQNNSTLISTDKNIMKTQPPISVVGPIGFSGNFQNVRVIQVINAQKADILYNRLSRSIELAKVVSELAGWTDGARFVQDQIWAKPPGAAPLTFHRDSPYFMFTPDPVVTVWVALDDMDDEIGPLQYVRKSHKWGTGRVGTAQQFFESHCGYDLLHSAAQLEGIDVHNNNNNNNSELDIVSMAGIRAGGISIHDGKTWHGSGRNNSKTKPRRGIGLHYVPVHVKFTTDAKYSTQWRHYVDGVDDPSQVELSERDFPIPWRPTTTTTTTIGSD